MIIMQEKQKSGVYNTTPYRNMLDISLDETIFEVKRSIYGLASKTIISIPIHTVTLVSLRRSIIMLFALCVEVEWRDEKHKRRTFLFYTFRKRNKYAWLATFQSLGVLTSRRESLRV